MSEKVAEWVEWDAAFTRRRRRLLRENGQLKIKERKEYQRDGEWKTDKETPDGMWGGVNANFLSNP